MGTGSLGWLPETTLGPHLLFQASHLARKQVGTASAVLDDSRTITKCDRSCKTNLQVERQIA